MLVCKGGVEVEGVFRVGRAEWRLIDIIEQACLDVGDLGRDDVLRLARVESALLQRRPRVSQHLHRTNHAVDLKQLACADAVVAIDVYGDGWGRCGRIPGRLLREGALGWSGGGSASIMSEETHVRALWYDACMRMASVDLGGIKQGSHRRR